MPRASIRPRRCERSDPIEGYGPPKKAGQRIGIVTASGNLDPASELFRSGAGFLIMPEDGPPPPSALDVVRAGRGRVDLAAALARLDQVMPAPTFIQVEGGPIRPLVNTLLESLAMERTGQDVPAA